MLVSSTARHIGSRGGGSRRRDCHSADTPSLSTLKPPTTGCGGCGRMTVPPARAGGDCAWGPPSQWPNSLPFAAAAHPAAHRHGCVVSVSKLPSLPPNPPLIAMDMWRVYVEAEIYYSAQLLSGCLSSPRWPGPYFDRPDRDTPARPVEHPSGPGRRG